MLPVLITPGSHSTIIEKGQYNTLKRIRRDGSCCLCIGLMAVNRFIYKYRKRKYFISLNCESFTDTITLKILDCRNKRVRPILFLEQCYRRPGHFGHDDGFYFSFSLALYTYLFTHPTAQAPITGWIQKHRGKPLLFHDKCPGFFYVHYTTQGTYSLTSHPKDEAIVVKWLAQGHKRRNQPDRDSNPHSDNTRTWVQRTRLLGHDTLRHPTTPQKYNSF